MFLTFLIIWGLLFLMVGILEKRHFQRWNPTKQQNSYGTTGILALTLLHTAIAIVAGLYVSLTAEPFAIESTPAQTIFLKFSLAFFTIDTLAMVIKGEATKDFYLHHIIVITGLGVVAFNGHFGWVMCMATAVGEMGPCIYLERMAKNLNITNRRFFFNNDVFYIGAFWFSRFFVYSPLAYFVVIQPAYPVALKASSIGLLSLSYYWLFLATRRFHRRYLRPEAALPAPVPAVHAGVSQPEVMNHLSKYGIKPGHSQTSQG
jgi:hypothetical protein